MFERIPVQRMRTFFGFSVREMEIVLSDLVARGHVLLEGEFASLQPAADELFSSSPDGMPRIVSVETWNETVSFDMVASTILPSERSFGSRHLIELRPSALSKEVPRRFAEEAFTSNFRDFVRAQKGAGDADSTHLYSIGHVEPIGYGWSTYRTSDFLDLSEGPKVEIDFGVGIEKFVSFRPLLEGMSSARNAQFSPAPDFLTLQFVDSIFGDARFSSFIRKDGYFDIERWIEREQPSGTPQSTRGIVGSIYLSDNIGAIALLASRQKSSAEKGSFDVIWARGAGSAWGASPDLPPAVSTMRNSMRGEEGESTVTSTFLDVHGTDNEIMRKFRHLFERGRSMRSRSLPRSMEFVKAGATLAFTVRIGIAPGSTLPVGFATTDTRLVDRFEKAISKARVDHVTMVSAVTLAYSAIEEMQLEPRPHGKRPVMKDGVWDEESYRDLRQRLDRAGVRSAAPVIWNVRGTPTRVHRAERAPKGERMSWTKGQVRDRGVSVEDALLAASWLRSRCTTHKFGKATTSISMFDVFNVQSLTRRLVLERTGIWEDILPNAGPVRHARKSRESRKRSDPVTPGEGSAQ